MEWFVSSLQELRDNPPVETLALFQDADGIDVGEAVLFSIATTWDSSLTITGDKRALVALADLSHQLGLIEKLSGRLKCLEQVVAEMMLNGFETQVIDKVHGWRWDRALGICFNSRGASDALECLSSYYKDLDRSCRGMLAPFPR
ncbi:MAG: hypothetical protein H6953_07440 [Chromatiaceae bacterium]|nr:hypothetical protein [Chromatiaceae bacterium]MCP5315222.1 hypothetical protein [Chromatiaceae bacterium]